MSVIFGFSVKNCLKISYYIFDLENISGQCYITLKMLYILNILFEINEDIFVAVVTWSTTARREIRNFLYPSVFELTGYQRLTVKKRNKECRSIPRG